MSTFGVVLAALLGFIWYQYNRLVSLRQLYKEAWSGIDVQLKRRADLIPNLVEIVKSYAQFEQETLERVSALRSKAATLSSDSESSPEQRAVLEQGIGREVRSILAVVEAYPELKASNQFLELHTQLVAVENDLQYARRYYNGTIRNINTEIERFPANLLAPYFGFRTQDFFEIEYATERQNPDVDLS